MKEVKNGDLEEQLLIIEDKIDIIGNMIFEIIEKQKSTRKKTKRIKKIKTNIKPKIDGE